MSDLVGPGSTPRRRGDPEVPHEYAADVLERVTAERDRYRAALVRISDAESGVYGQIAAEALRGDRR